jgi:serine/threonine-protein kinase
VPENAAPDNAVPDDAVPAVTVRPHAQTGEVISGRYRLVRLIASGGMAEVWEAEDQVLGRQVAVKLLHRHLADDETFTQRFRAEAVAAARLHHPSIVAIYDTCTDGTHEAIVMELVRGRTLRAYLDERHQLPADEVVQIGADVSAALAAAHRARIVHRDIKPANILLCDDARVMVTDFGIAKVRDETDLTSTGTMLGTVKYLAPEQVESRSVDGRTDIYSLGVVMYECLVGRPPFVGDTAAATALARLHQVPPRPSSIRPDVPPALEAAVLRALARDPSERFPDADDLRSALLARETSPPVLTDPTVVAAAGRVDPTTWGPPPPRPTPQAFPLAAPPPAARTAVPTATRPRPRSTRDWLLPTVLVLLIGGSIGLALALVARTQSSDPPAAGDSEAAPVRFVSASSFDPFGGDGEHDDEVAFTIDGDPSTAWRTETYQERDFGAKPGVGIVLELDRPSELQSLRVDSPTTGWAAAIYVADEPARSLDGWGDPVTSASSIDGGATFRMAGADGRAVLVWITRLGEQPHRVEIDAVTASA